MKNLFTGIFIFLLTLAIIAQSKKEKGLPKFNSYPPLGKFKGKKAKLVMERQHAFRTRMREAYSQKPNFAGHYIIGDWGCGAPCRSVVIFDANTGRQVGGLRVSNWAGSSTFPCSIHDPMEYHLNSRLLIVYGSLDDQKTGIYYFVLGKNSLKQIWTIEEIEQLKKHPGCNSPA